MKTLPGRVAVSARDCHASILMVPERLLGAGWHRLFLPLLIALLALAAKVPAQVSSSQSSGPNTVAASERLATLGKEAERDLANRDYAAAIRKYEELAPLEPNSANVFNNLGLAYHMAGRPHDAIRVLQKALRLKPDMLSANLILGIDYVQVNEPGQALHPLERALRLDGNNRDVIFALASAHFALRHFDQAARLYQHEVNMRPEDADAWYGMGMCYEHVAENTSRQLSEVASQSSYNQRLQGEFMIEQQRGVEAEQAFRSAFAAASAGEREGLHAGLGFARLRLGEVGGAKDEFQSELQAHPGNLEAMLGLADVAMEQHDWAHAVGYLCKIHAADGGFFRSRLDFFLTLPSEQTAVLAVSRLVPGDAPPDCSQAIAAVRNALSSDQPEVDFKNMFGVSTLAKHPVHPPSSQAMASARRHAEAGRFAQCARTLQPFKLQRTGDVLLLSRCYAFSGQYLMSLDTVRNLVRAEPQNPGALYWQAEAARKLAQAAMQRAVGLKPDSWQGQVLLGDMFRQRKKWDLAISHYQTAARLKPQSPGPLLGLANIHWQLGQNPQAEKALKKALEIAPDNLLGNFMLGDVYVRMRRFGEAVPYLERCLAHGSTNLAVHGDLGKAFAALGRNKEAISELTKALPTDKNGQLYYRLFVLYKKEGETRLAQEAFSKSKELRAKDREDRLRRVERVVGAKQDSSGAKP